MAKAATPTKGKYIPMVMVACPQRGPTWANPKRPKNNAQDYRCTGCGQDGHAVIR